MAEIPPERFNYPGRPSCPRGCGLVEHPTTDCRLAKQVYDIRNLIEQVSIKRQEIRALRHEINEEEQELSRLLTDLQTKLLQLFPPLRERDN